MIDLRKTTFVIPLVLESEDRIRNTYIVLNYLLSNFDTTIIIKEVDKESKFSEKVVPLLQRNLLDSQLKNLKHIFEKNTSNVFHKSKYINDMCSMVTSEVICNYDIDVILPIESYVDSEKMCLNGYDLVYPFEYGNGQYRLNLVSLNDYLNLPNQFLSFQELIGISKSYDLWTSTFGHTQFFNTSSFKKYYMMNENFSSYSPEDLEISIRYNKLECKIGRINNKLIHIEHERFFNSVENNVTTQKNNHTLGLIKNFDKKQLIEYYNSQEYYKKRISENA